MKAKLVLAAIAWTVLSAPATWAQKGIEVTPFAGEQINHGLDVSTALYNRLDVNNGLNYGVVAGYALNTWGSVEFMWNHN